MEKSRAIELLKLAVPIKALTQQEYADFVEAVNMGMDALEQPTSPDTIDRKAALDALRKCQTYLYDARDPELKIELSSAEAAINNLSTIQPEKAQLSQEDATKDTISRQQAIDAANDWYEGLICGSINGLIKRLNALPTIQPEKAQHSQEGTTSDMISRTKTVESLRKALYEYEEKTEKQFQESEDLDVGDWIEHRIFVQNMNDIDRQTILNLPPVQPEPQWIQVERELPEDFTDVLVWFEYFRYGDYNCLYQTHGIGTYVANYNLWTVNHETGWKDLRVIAWMPLPEAYKPNK